MHKIDQRTFKISKTGMGFKIWSPADNIHWSNPTVVVLCSTVWSKALTKKFNQKRITRVQRLMNIRISKVFRTTSNKALCVLTGLAPLTIELQEIVKKYELERNGNVNVDTSLELKKWPHPEDIPKIEGVNPMEAYVLYIYTDGSKSEGVGSGLAIFHNNELTHQLKFRLDTSCSSN